MKMLERLLKREDGMAMATVVMMIAVLTLLGIVLIDQVKDESTRAVTAVNSNAVYQAAEAGLNDYIAKLVDDPQFYDHQVANGESTRQPDGGGSTVGPGGEWDASTSWTYDAGKDTWYRGTGTNTTLQNNAYNLMISPPVAAVGSNPAREYLTIVSTGCQLLVGGTTCDPAVPQRAIEVRLKRVTPADFSFMYAETPSAPWGESATTYGNIYSLGDLCHDGTSHGHLMAEGRVNRSGCYHGSNATVTFVPPAQKYDSTTTPRASCPSGSTPPCPLKKAIQFETFATSLTDIKRAAALNTPSTVFDYAGTAIRIVFGAGSGSDGTLQVWSCTPSSGSLNAPKTEPTTCTQRYSGSLPQNGAIYAGQDTIVSTPSLSSVVNGRVTVASNDDIVVGGHIRYQSQFGGENDDVLGLIANNNVWVANYAPNNLFWRAAMIAENGSWSVYDCSYSPHSPSKRGSTSLMTFVGSMASKNADGCANTGDPQTDPSGGFAQRIYAADDGSYSSQYNALKFLFPPWYPVLDAQATVLFREVPAAYEPTLP